MDERSFKRRDNAMIIKGLLDEDFVNYRVPSMFISTARCNFKCDKECGENVCQNSSLAKQAELSIDDDLIVERYLNNPITNAVIFSGLEPFDQFAEMYELIGKFRDHTDDDIVIYTGYVEEEIPAYIFLLKNFANIIVKFGRYIPGQKKHYDDVLGIKLASDNQYGVRIS